MNMNKKISLTSEMIEKKLKDTVKLNKENIWFIHLLI